MQKGFLSYCDNVFLFITRHGSRLLGGALIHYETRFAIIMSSSHSLREGVLTHSRKECSLMARSGSYSFAGKNSRSFDKRICKNTLTTRQGTTYSLWEGILTLCEKKPSFIARKSSYTLGDWALTHSLWGIDLTYFLKALTLLRQTSHPDSLRFRI